MKLKNYKDGDIYPENHEIREHFFKLGEKYEKQADRETFSNENVEIKTQEYETTLKYGNLFVEHTSQLPGSTEFKPSGISISTCNTWVFQFYHKDKLLPFSINLNRNYLLDVIQKGLQEGWVKQGTTDNLETGDYNYGYLVPIMFVMEPVMKNTYKLVRELFWDRNFKEIDLNNPEEVKKRLSQLKMNQKNK
jgi:hypothetical protein